MKKYIFLIISLVLFFACEDKQEKDCTGVEGGTATVDNCGTCDNDSTNDCPVGTYMLSIVTSYESDDCSGEGIIGICYGDYETEEECLAAGEEFVTFADHMSEDGAISLTMNADTSYSFQGSTDCNGENTTIESNCTALGGEWDDGNCSGYDSPDTESVCTAVGGEWNDGMQSGTWIKTNNIYTYIDSEGENKELLGMEFQFISGNLVADNSSGAGGCHCEGYDGEHDNYNDVVEPETEPDCTNAEGEWECQSGCTQFTLTPTSGS